MWEIYTGGEMPYSKLRNTQVIDKVVHQKYRLEQPEHCPDDMYRVMHETWEQVSQSSTFHYFV